jgi:tetratricopeptide (TPR) repeat protein
MNKENVLFGIIGLLAGLIIGFFFANSVNQSAMTAASAAMQQTSGAPSGSLPPGHPNVPGNNAGGMTPEVQAAIDKAHQNPNDYEAQMKAAEMFYKIQRFDGAIEFLTQANKLQPDNFEVMTDLGNANFDTDKYEEAEKWYTAALAKKPDEADVRTDLGLTFIFREKPNYDRAIEEFKQVLSSNPSHVQALQNLTVAYTKKPDPTNPKATLAKLEEVDPSNKAITQLRGDIQKLPAK